MRKMFRPYLLFTAVAMAAVSCAKNEIDSPVVSEGLYTYSFNLASEDTKAQIGDDSIEYESGDALGVFVGSTVNSSSSVDVTSVPVRVSVTASEALAAGDVIYAYYPWSSVNASATASAVTMSVPAQQYQKGTVFDADAMPMVGVPYEVAGAVEAGAAQSVGDLYMNNLGAVIEFGIYGAEQSGDKIHSVTFTSETAVAGSFTYDLASTDLLIPALDGKSVKTVVNSSLAVGADKANAAKVYMVVAPGTHKGSIAVRTEDATYTITVADAIAFNRSKVRPLTLNLANASRDAEIKMEWLTGGMGQVRCNLPAVDKQGNVYMTTGKDAKLYKLNPDGKLAWTFDMGFTPDNNTSPSIEADGSVVYAGGGSSGTGCWYAVNADGTQKWKFASDQFFANGNIPAPNFNQTMAVVGSENIYIANAGTTGTMLSINKTTGQRIAYVSGKSDGTGGPSGGTQSGLGMSKDGYLAWHIGYGTFVVDQKEMDNPSRTHATYGGYAPWCYRYGYNWNSGQPWRGGVRTGVAFLSIDNKNYVAAAGVELTSSGGYNMRIFAAPVGETTNTWPGLTQTWKGIYNLQGIKNQDQGGIVIGPQNEIIVSLKNSSSSPGGVAAVSTDDFSLLYRFNAGVDVAGTPAVDAAGNVHFVTDSPGWYYIIKPDYVNKTATLVKKVNLYDLAVASGMDVLGADKARMWSSIAIGDDGRMYVGLTLQKTDGTVVSGGVVCFTYEGCTGPGNTPWPMKGADARRSGIQLK